MYSLTWLRASLSLALLLLCTTLARAETTLDAPESAPSGSKVPVKWTGPKQRFDRIGVVPEGSPDGTKLGKHAAYTFDKSPVHVLIPEEPGKYELRFVAGRSGGVLARRKLDISAVTATLAAAESIVGGQTLKVSFTGPRNQFDRIGIVEAGAAEGTSAGKYGVYTFNETTVGVKAPERAGDYELRYLRGESGKTLASRKLTISGASASVRGPGKAVSGATISVGVTGPHGNFDCIGVVPAGAPDPVKLGRYRAYTFGKAQVKVRIPEQPGEFEIRYVTGDKATTLARDSLSITGTSASLEGPAKTPAGEHFPVSWKGPGNRFDHIVVAPEGAPEDKWATSSYVYKDSPIRLRAPVLPGPYELRYQTGETGTTLARAKLEVVPAEQEPGLLQVTAAQSLAGSAAGGAVEVILDASGSMLQKLGSERRIDVAKQTLTHLTSEVIPAGTPFALRVFGRQAKSCQSDLDIPLQPLDAAAVAAKVAALQAQSSARTPIGASLEKVAADLKAFKGERLVILVTDGEETCGGDPRRAIQALRKGGANVRVSIVGFALDDDKLAATFRQWSVAGNGTYFDARDAAGLKQALTAAVRPAYAVLDAKKVVIAEGLAGDEPVPLLPGTYTVQPKGETGRSRTVTVRAKQTARVTF